MPLTASAYVGNIRDTVTSFWHGMSVTLSQVLRRPITQQHRPFKRIRCRQSMAATHQAGIERHHVEERAEAELFFQ